MKGIVTKSTGSWYQVLLENGDSCAARIRGKFRLLDKDTSNPIAVGDEVVVTAGTENTDSAIISELLPRRNHIVRRSNKLSSRRQVIAANVDLAVLVASMVAPRTSLGFIDRFILCCESFHIPVLLFYNKTDLLSEDGMEILEEIAQMYRNAGYPVLFGSALHPDGLAELSSILSGKTVLFSGHSGVGKSTLLNSLFPEAGARVGKISDMHDKGKHTTTFAEMHLMKNNTRIIDTPGIRDFGIVDLPPNEVGQFFPEIRKFASHCKFNNCVHLSEPGCAVKDAVDDGQIAQERYYSYQSIMRGEDVFE